MPRSIYRTLIPHPPEAVFAWHTRPRAFERLTPPWEDVRILRKEGGMEPGGRVLLEIRKGPARVRWEVLHTEFTEGVSFQDVQARGPWADWCHDHRFLPSEGGTWMHDEIRWRAPLGPLGGAVAGGLLETTLDRMFTFRHARLAHDLALHAHHPLRGRGGGASTIAISGSSGFLGRQLGAFLESGGHRVLPLVRRRREEGAPRGSIAWDPRGGWVDQSALEGVDAVIHLAGESIAGGRWTRERKRRILESRTVGTSVLARALAGLDRPPSVFLSVSGIGFYGDRDDEWIDERSPAGTGFLAEVCEAWEGAADPARKAGIRTVHPRIGVVLSPAGGALPRMLPPFLAGVGGPMGSGDQYLPWIDLDDLIGIFVHSIATPAVEGPVNVTAPTPVRNRDFAKALGRVLERPALLPLPAFAVRALLGEMGDTLLLEGARVLPEKAMETGYRFLLPTLEDSLRFQLGRGPVPRGN